jgi:hypothetical protein
MRHGGAALLVVALLLLGACRDGAETTSERAGTSTPEAPVAVTGGDSGRSQAVARFLSQRIAGDRPFHTVADYLTWLLGRPGTAGYAVDATPEADGGWRISVTLRAEDGRELTTGCRYGLETRFATTGVFWGDCGEMTGLWTAFAPSSFGSVAEALPFLPPVPVLLPETPPDSYQVVRVTLPAEGGEAGSNPFVFSVIFADDAGREVTLLQQPAGLNTAIFADWQACEAGRWSGPGICRSWASMGAYFLLQSETVTDDTLRQFERAIDPRR